MRSKQVHPLIAKPYSKQGGHFRATCTLPVDIEISQLLENTFYLSTNDRAQTEMLTMPFDLWLCQSAMSGSFTWYLDIQLA